MGSAGGVSWRYGTQANVDPPWSFVAIQQTNRKYLATLHPQLWDYLDYLLVETVLWHGVESGWSCGLTSGPSWKVMLLYEYEIRAAAHKRVMKGEDLADGLRTSWVYPVAKERPFATPLCWEARQEYTAKAPRTGSYDNSKGKAKRARSRVVRRFNADGKRICFTFNNPNQKCTMGKNCRILA